MRTRAAARSSSARRRALLGMKPKHAVTAAVAALGASARASVPTTTNPSRCGRKLPAVQAGPLTGMIVQVLLLAALAGTVALSGVGLGAAGWLAGVGCGVITNLALARRLSHYRCERMAPAGWVTLARATLVGGVAALVADSFDQPVPVTLLVSLSA